MYTVGTHAGLDSSSDSKKYGAVNNSTLNTLCNIDKSFGIFWNYFLNSSYKDNTIIVFTANHTHYYEKPYIELIKDDYTYKLVFVDTIPLIICDPTNKLPNRYDAKDDASLALAPTILHLLNYKNAKNAFLERQYLMMKGNYIYMRKKSNFGISLITEFTQKERYLVNV